MKPIKYVLLTGAAGAIARVIAKSLIAEGYGVIGIDKIDKPKDFLGEYYQVNFLDKEDVLEITLQNIIEQYPIYGLVHAAGIVTPSLFNDLNPSDFDNVMRINTRAFILCAQSAAKSMRQHYGEGRIISISSIAAFGKINRSAYAASKGALNSLTMTWALELGKDKITVNAIAPGAIATSFFYQQNPPESETTLSWLKSIPLQRFGTPEDIAAPVCFLLSSGASYVTGQILVVCGGYTVGSVY